MKPTMNLRFIEKDIMVPHPQHKNVSFVKTVRILQQWWEADVADAYNLAIQGKPSGEWREVPLEKNP